MKATFIKRWSNEQVAITSARRVGELRAVVSGLPYTVFYKDKVHLHPYPKFLTNQAIYLPTFFPNPHVHKDEQRLYILDVFYLARTNPIVCGSCRQDEKTSDLFSNLTVDLFLHMFMLQHGQCNFSEEGASAFNQISCSLCRSSNLGAYSGHL